MLCSCGSEEIKEYETNSFQQDKDTFVQQTFCRCTRCGRAFWKYEYFKKFLTDYCSERKM